MKVRYFILFVSFFLYNIAHSQEIVRKNVVVYSAGLAMPASSFAKDTFGFYSGFAKPGFGISFDYFRYSFKYFTWHINAAYSNFQFNRIAYQNAYNRVLNSENSVHVNSGNYQVYKLLAGFAIKIPISRKIEILLPVQIGCAYSIHPSIFVYNDEFGQINLIDRSAGFSTLKAYGVIANYTITDKYWLNFSHNSNYTNPKFYKKVNTKSTFNLPIDYRGLNVGITIKL